MRLKRVRATFTNPELKAKMLFTLVILLIFRTGVNISVPGVDVQSIKDATTGPDAGVFQMMNMLGGGALQNYSIFSLGVGPYITASIVIQLLAMDIVPYLADLQNGGDAGRKKIGQITRYVAIVLAFVQAYMTTVYFHSQQASVNNASPLGFITIALYMTAGTMLILWLADQITAKGIGNGTSMIIFAGIVDKVPYSFYQMIEGFFLDPTIGTVLAVIFGIALMALFITLIWFTVKTQQAQRKIPVQYASNSSKAGEASYLPFKINVAGVIPVIFASTILMVPATLIQFFVTTDNQFTTVLKRIFNYTDPIGMLMYIILIYAFTYFYANLQVDSKKLSENLARSGGYIIGIRPGEETEKFINRTINRLNFLGATSLAIIAIVPVLLPYLPYLNISKTQAQGLGGTGLIIVVGVSLDVVNKIDGMIKTRKQRNFIK